jgi:hypothetical protein
MPPRTFHSYPSLFAELQGEVRCRATASAQLMLSMTCKAEQAAAAASCDHVYLPHGLLFALARDGENRLLRRVLQSPKLHEYERAQRGAGGGPPLHEVKHIAMRTHNLRLARWLLYRCTYFEWKTCPTCVALAAETRNHAWILDVRHAYMKEHGMVGVKRSGSNILTVTAIYMNDVPLLAWLESKGLLQREFDLHWQNNDDDGDAGNVANSRKALEAWDAWLFMRSRVTHDDVFAQVRTELFACMIERQWSMDALLVFANDRMGPELSIVDEDGEILTAQTTLEYYALRLFYLALVCRNMSVVTATWASFARTHGPEHWAFRYALNFLARHDTSDDAMGKTLLQPTMVTGLFMTEKTKAYVDRVLSLPSDGET